MLIGQYSLTQIVNDIFAIILFFMCLFHSLRQKIIKIKRAVLVRTNFIFWNCLL
jgi:hypothetical protein